MSLKTNKTSGFTLLEILLVVGIIAILAGIVIMAINPTKQLSSVRNVQRKANLAELNKALYQYYIDNSHYPVTLTTTLTEICDTEATSTGHSLNCTNKIDLSPLVPTYLTAIPTDPQATGTTTGYYVAKNTANKIHLKADSAELAQTTTIGDTTGVLPDHLVSYWSFDGNANDSWGGNNGTVTNGAVLTTGVKGQANTAYAFDGVDDYILLSGPVSIGISSGKTGCAWVKPVAHTNSLAGVIAGTSNKGPAIKLVTNGKIYNRIQTSTGGASSEYSSNTAISVGQWSQICVVWKGNGVSQNLILQYYINGSLDSNIVSDVVDTNGNVGQSSGIIRIGSDPDIASRIFNGSIDNVRMYNKALSAEEVLNLYNIEKP